jgi:aryl-alcohol dehydrogenase-like predicted oxidoreductase
MQTREIGKTGLKLSVIGFGCGGNAGLMVRGAPAEQTRMVARALELGINYFDNAPDYGAGRAEEALGRALKEIGARPMLNSKVEIRARDLNDVAGHVVRSAEESLKRLGVERLDVFQIHNGPALRDPGLAGEVYTQLQIDHFTGPNGAMEGLERLRRAGKIGCAGFICRGNDASEVVQLMETGAFAIVNVPYTLFNPTAGAPKPAGLKVKKDFGAVIAHGLARGVGAAIYSPLAGGYLTDDALRGDARHPLARGPREAPEIGARYRDMARQVSFLAREAGHTLAQAAYRFILDHRGVTTALGGFSSLEQLEEIAAMGEAAPLSDADRARLSAIWESDFQT